jgi:PEGA domain
MPSLSFLKSSPPTEALRIESEPAGAEAKTSLGQSCRTPCELTVQTPGEMTVTLALAGYQSQAVTVTPGGDADGGQPRLAPNPVYVEFVPAPVAPPPKKKPPKKKPKPQTSTARAAPGPAPAPVTAAAPPMAPTSTAEPAVSATQYPWPSR